MAWVDRRHARGEEREERRLRPLQAKSNLTVSVGDDAVEVAVPDLARGDPKLLAAFALQQFPGAFDIGCGERLCVTPFDAVPQLEGQLGAFLVPAPAFRQLWPSCRGCFASHADRT